MGDSPAEERLPCSPQLSMAATNNRLQMNQQIATGESICPACQQKRALAALVAGQALPPSVGAAIQQRHSAWSPQERVCRTCVNEGKVDGMQAMLEAEMGPLSSVEREVLESVRHENLLTTNAEDEFEQGQDLGERFAHRFVGLVGSWPFAIGILVFVGSRILVNLFGRPFEPYPMIMLAGMSAVLASLAGLQGPVIIMSQRYQRKRDRLRAQHEYRINLKAELEVQYLTEQMEHLLQQQQALAKQ